MGGLCSRGLTAWNGGGFADAFDVYRSRALAAGTGLRPRTSVLIDFGQRLDSFGHSGLRRRRPQCSEHTISATMDRYALGRCGPVTVRGFGMWSKDHWSVHYRWRHALSYSTGAQFGAVTISSSTSLLIIAVVWVVVFGVVFELARRVQQTGAGENNNPQAAA